MDIIIYVIGCLFALFFLIHGYTKQNFATLYLAFATIIFIGLAIGQFGVSIESGVIVTESGSDMIITKTYQIYDTSNWIINIIHLTFTIGGIIMLLLASVYVLTDR
jgi:hypothetical protein